ncbi:MAG TPA: hypothetical protein DD392_04440 [Ruminococcus sp.]|nr:hypothetical protein [Ruminococcus sp.]
MTDYNKQNFNNMKNEAVRSAREMQKKAPDSSCTDTAENNTGSSNNNNGLFGLAGGFLKNLGITDGNFDSDKMVIILMIIILAREGADLKLLLALGYILM